MTTSNKWIIKFSWEIKNQNWTISQLSLNQVFVQYLIMIILNRKKHFKDYASSDGTSTVYIFPLIFLLHPCMQETYTGLALN